MQLKRERKTPMRAQSHELASAASVSFEKEEIEAAKNKRNSARLFSLKNEKAIGFQPAKSLEKLDAAEKDLLDFQEMLEKMMLDPQERTDAENSNEENHEGSSSFTL